MTTPTTLLNAIKQSVKQSYNVNPSIFLYWLCCHLWLLIQVVGSTRIFQTIQQTNSPEICGNELTLDGVNYRTINFKQYFIPLITEPLLFLEKVCFHPEDIVGTLINQDDKITTYFVDGRSYYLTCPLWYRVPDSNNTLWTCLDGIWVSGDDCIGKSLFIITHYKKWREGWAQHVIWLSFLGSTRSDYPLNLGYQVGKGRKSLCYVKKWWPAKLWH